MGVVYKAEDTRLQRSVALKFLLAELADDPEALTRFQREARAASALNHPNICTIYDIGEQDGRAFIAMEFLDGTTLKQRIAGRATRRSETLLALVDRNRRRAGDRARRRDRSPRHQAGEPLRHRARSRQDSGLRAGQNPCRLASLTRRHDGRPTFADLTTPGSALGTVAYMSPEQVRGQDVDARTDLFSFGVVLYEMATGTAPFQVTAAGVIFDGDSQPRTGARGAAESSTAAGSGTHHREVPGEGSRRFATSTPASIRADLQRLQRDLQSAQSIPAGDEAAARGGRAAAVSGSRSARRSSSPGSPRARSTAAVPRR